MSLPLGLIRLTTVWTGRPNPSTYCVVSFTSAVDLLESNTILGSVVIMLGTQLRTELSVKFVSAPGCTTGVAAVCGAIDGTCDLP